MIPHPLHGEAVAVNTETKNRPGRAKTEQGVALCQALPGAIAMPGAA
jgi:hypothetical protein